MKLAKIFITALLCFFCSVFAKAENTSYDVIFLLKDGTESVFALSSKPDITFDSTTVYVKSEDFNVSLSDVKNFHFKANVETPTSIDQVKEKNHADFVFQFTDGRTVTILGYKETDKVAVYSVNGMKVGPVTEQSSDRVILHFDSLPSGSYVIQVNSNSYKILKR